MFEQDLITFLSQQVSNGIFISADLTGVNETTFVGDAKVFIMLNDVIQEKKIFLYKVNDVITYNMITPSNDKEKILVDIPRRTASENETLPNHEILDGFNKYFQIRYDYSEVIENDIRYFYFKYVDVLENNRECIINTMIRKKYTQEQENAILRKRLLGLESLEFLKFNNWVSFSKAVADNLDLTPIKNQQVYEITIPLDLCNLGFDYGGMAFQTIIKNITFEADVINNTGKAYPSWISNSDLGILGFDPRVLVQQINLYEEV